MPPLLTTATRKELDAAVPDLAEERIPEHMVVPVRVRGRPWLACVTGVGPINAGTAMGLALARHPDISGVLNMGLAGTFDPDAAPLGATVLITEEIWPEYGLADDTGVDAEGLGFPLWEEGPRRVWDRLPVSATPQALGLSIPPDTIQGASLTVAGVTNSPERAARLRGRYHALTENMEGFAVALACARQNVPLLEVRTISNRVGSRAPADRNFSAALAQLDAALAALFL